MLSRNLINFRRTLLIGIVIITAAANSVPMWWGLALGQVTFALLILIVGSYLFEVVFYNIRSQNE